MKRQLLILLGITLVFVNVVCGLCASVGQEWSDIRKEDINADGIKETITVVYFQAVTGLSRTLRIFHPRYGKVLDEDLLDYSGFAFVDIDKHCLGKEVVVWKYITHSLVNGQWQEEGHLVPHFYLVRALAWNGKAYQQIEEWKTPKRIETTKVWGKTTDLPYCQFLAFLKSRKPNPSAQTIEKAVELFCKATSLGWAKPPNRDKFEEKKVINRYASIATIIVDSAGNHISEYVSFLLVRDKSGWRVVEWSDERSISQLQVKRSGLPQDIVKKLGWSLWEN